MPAKMACWARRMARSSRPPSRRSRPRGHDVRGPLSADTLFHAEARASYDAALCMYHDQALIPIKTLSFWDGRERDAGPAHRAHLARSRHSLRHRRHGQGRSAQHDRRDQAWRRRWPMRGRRWASEIRVTSIQSTVIPAKRCVSIAQSRDPSRWVPGLAPPAPRSPGMTGRVCIQTSKTPWTIHSRPCARSSRRMGSPRRSRWGRTSCSIST